jgi:hypothetical protein
MNQAKERLFEQAFAFRDHKVGKVLGDSPCIGLRLPDQRQVYFQVMGDSDGSGEGPMLIAYGYDHPEEARRRMALASNEDVTLAERIDQICRLDCIHCMLSTKDQLSKEEENEAREYAKAHGLQFRGKNSFPHFARYTPNQLPNMLEEENDIEYLAYVLEASCFLAKELGSGRVDRDLLRIYLDGEQLILLYQEDGTWKLTVRNFPALPPEENVAYEPQNEIALKRIKGFPRKGNFQCQLLRLDMPVLEETDEGTIPVFPVQLFVVDAISGYVMAVPTEGLPDDNFQSVLENWLSMLLDEKLCPKSVSVKDERTRLLLQSACDKLHIPVQKKDSLPELEEFEENFLLSLHEAEENGELDDEWDDDWDEDWDDDWDEEDPDEMWTQFLMMNEDIMSMPQREIASFVGPVQDRFMEMLSDPEVPEAAKNSIRRMLEKAHISVPQKPAIQLLKRTDQDK